jgi:hypothetical protein
VSAKVLLVVLMGVLVFAGVLILRGAGTKSVEIEQETAPKRELVREEDILHAFFPDELAQKTIAHLELYDLPRFEEVIQPRPQLSKIVERFGPADSVVEEDLNPFGISQLGQTYYYGRLGLVTPANRNDGEIFWVHIAGR